MHLATVAQPQHLSLPTLFLRFFRFGCLAFGGPVAQIAMLQETLVEREGWIDRARFNRLLAVMQVLPGPEAHELCVHLGMVARGRIGGMLAGLGFMLPGLCLMLAAGWLYVRFVEDSTLFSGVLLGVQIAVLGVIVRAVWRIGSHVIEDRTLALIAAAAFAATLVGAPFWLPLAAAGLAQGLPRTAAAAAVATLAAIALVFTGGTTADPAIAAATAATPTHAALFTAGLKGGLLTFGGAYTAIPYVRADTVGRSWLSDGSFLDGVAIAGVLPAPLVIFATFAGYVAGGIGGALAITAGMFLPAFAFSLIFFERLEALVASPALHRLLTGVAAAVVGIIGATAIQLALAAALRVPNLWVGAAMLIVSLGLASRLTGGWVTPLIVALGGVSGWLLLG